MINNIWKEHIDEKLSNLPEGKSFIYVTDVHEGDVHESGKGKCHYETISLMDYAASKGNIKNVVLGGDTVGSEKTAEDAIAVIDSCMVNKGSFYDTFGSNVIVNIGNHETNCVALSYNEKKMNGFDGTKTKADLLITEGYIYESYIKPMEESGNVKYDEIGIAAAKKVVSSLDINLLKKIYTDLGYSEDMCDEQLRRYFTGEVEALFKFHYTYTDDINKIKYIMVDCGANGPMQYGIINQDYTDIFNIQFYWLAYELMNTPDGYDIVVSSHMFGDNPERSEVYEPTDFYRNINNEILDMTNVTFPIYSILTAFKGKRSVNIPGEKAVQPDNFILKNLVNAIKEEYMKNADYIYDGIVSFERDTEAGKIITLSGHWHRDDMFLVSQNMEVTGYEGQKITDEIPVVFVAASSVKRGRMNKYMNAESPNSACFDIITFTEDSIKLTRVGAGIDREIKY